MGPILRGLRLLTQQAETNCADTAFATTQAMARPAAFLRLPVSAMLRPDNTALFKRGPANAGGAESRLAHADRCGVAAFGRSSLSAQPEHASDAH